MSQRIPPGSEAGRRSQPPGPKAGIVAVVVLASLWLTFTVFARPLAPMIGAIGERIEVGLGLDVSTGDRMRGEEE